MQPRDENSNTGAGSEDVHRGKDNTSKDSLIAAFLGRRGYLFMTVPLAMLCGIYYYILDPSNFDSFSNTLRYFISALSTLLAVVVSFNTLALRSQLKNMPTNTERLEKQLNKIDNLLQPVRQDNHNNGIKNNRNIPVLSYSNAIESMLMITKKRTESEIQNSENSRKGDISKSLGSYKGFVQQIDNKLAMYRKYKSPFYLVSISTTEFVERVRFNMGSNGPANDRPINDELFDISKRLHVLRNIGVRIFIRNALTKLSSDMLVFTIPIITFAAIISAISNYDSYNTLYLRILFAASMSTVALPFILLFIRILPVLQLIRSSSSIPFAKED